MVDKPPAPGAVPEAEPPCKTCGGSGFVAQKQFIDDGYGEVDSCPTCATPADAPPLAARPPEDDLRQGCECTCCDHSEGSDCGCECHSEGQCAAALSVSRAPLAARPPGPTLCDLAQHLGLGNMSAQKAYDFLFERERLLRVVQDRLETHKSDAESAEGALVERIELLKALAVSRATPGVEELRKEIATLSAAWLKAAEGYEGGPAGRATLRHGQVLRDVLARTSRATPAPQEDEKIEIRLKTALTAVISDDLGHMQAERDVVAVKNGSQVLNAAASEMYFHGLRLAVAKEPELAKSFTVLYRSTNGELREIGLGRDDELTWPVGFLQSGWEIETEIQKSRWAAARVLPVEPRRQQEKIQEARVDPGVENSDATGTTAKSSKGDK